MCVCVCACACSRAFNPCDFIIARAERERERVGFFSFDALDVT